MRYATTSKTSNYPADMSAIPRDVAITARKGAGPPILFRLLVDSNYFQKTAFTLRSAEQKIPVVFIFQNEARTP